MEQTRGFIHIYFYLVFYSKYVNNTLVYYAKMIFVYV